MTGAVHCARCYVAGLEDCECEAPQPSISPYGLRPGNDALAQWVRDGIAQYIEDTWPHNELWPPDIADRIREIEIRSSFFTEALRSDKPEKSDSKRGLDHAAGEPILSIAPCRLCDGNKCTTNCDHEELIRQAADLHELLDRYGAERDCNDDWVPIPWTLYARVEQLMMRHGSATNECHRTTATACDG